MCSWMWTISFDPIIMKNTNLSNIQLHEATILSFAVNDCSCEMSFSKDGDVFAIKTDSLKSLTEEGSCSQKNDLMFFSDGEVIFFELKGDEINLIIEWNNFATKNQVTKEYFVKASSFYLVKLA